ncbi:MAG: ABC transporter ATP-binding protein [Pseudomonadota bacterium]|nr:ABC transporter ATP-binding protein [Pseudomonadota bacterium]
MIHVKHLVFDYPGHRALHGVSLHIAQGTITALVGPNGAGKSTLLRCLAGLDVPLAGQIQVAGIDVLEHPRQAHARLGYLSDFFGLYAELTVAQCLRHAAAAQGVPASQLAAQVQRTAQMLGLQDKLHALTTALSRGQRQRVAIGQAIVHQPQVLLLDEPASGLDPEARSSLAGLFRQLQAQGMTLLVSSHILSELDEYCTHILALRGGRVTQHESLHAGAAGEGAATHVLLTAQWAAAVPQLAQRLADALAALPFEVQVLTPPPGASDTALAPAATQLRLASADLAARAALLAALVQAGLPLAGLTETRSSLQASYARSLRQGEPA